MQTQLQVELISVMHQLGMTDFVVDLNRYLKELASIQNLIKEAATALKNLTPSTSLSPLTKEEEVTLTHTKIWWTGSDHDVSLTCDHPVISTKSRQVQLRISALTSTNSGALSPR